jgi:GDP-mannose 6-dehydrogenase
VVLKQILQFEKDKIGFLGLSFKGGTDDLRNSPILDIIEILLGKGLDIRIYDQNVRFSELMGANREYILKKIPYVSKFIVETSAEIIAHADVIVIVNKEKEFETILTEVPEHKILYDLVNIDVPNKQLRKNYSGIAW